MEHATSPALPAPLPRPLSDPLRVYRRLLFVILVVGWVAIVVHWLLPRLGPTTGREKVDWAFTAAAFTLWLCVFSILPRRAANAIYLRSFRNDARTGGLRVAAQAALGREYRLSGIRDPRRRWPWLVRHLLYILFLIRYAQPRYMNLEAGADWKARLWRSLGDARCALIDVTDLTPFVREEVELAVVCLGLHRTLFVADDSRTADEWRRAVLAVLGSPDVAPGRINVATWADTPAGRAAFQDQVRAFAAGLPANPPGTNAAAYPDVPSPNDPGGNAVQGEGWLPFLLASAIGAGLAGALGWAEGQLPGAGLVWFLPVVVLNALAALLLVQYFAECGSAMARLRLGGTFLLGAVFGLLPAILDLLTPPREGVRDVVARATTVNNLEQMAQAVREAAVDEKREKWRDEVGRAQFLDVLEAVEKKSLADAGTSVLLSAEDWKARGTPEKVSLAALVAEDRADPKATDEKYRNKWLAVVGKVAAVTRRPAHLIGPSSTAAFGGSLRYEELDLVVKPADGIGSDVALRCSFFRLARAVPDGVAEGGSLADVKEGDTVTILGKWSRPPPSLLQQLRAPATGDGPGRLVACELTR